MCRGPPPRRPGAPLTSRISPARFDLRTYPCTGSPPETAGSRVTSPQLANRGGAVRMLTITRSRRAARVQPADSTPSRTRIRSPANTSLPPRCCHVRDSGCQRKESRSTLPRLVPLRLRPRPRAQRRRRLCPPPCPTQRSSRKTHQPSPFPLLLLRPPPRRPRPRLPSHRLRLQFPRRLRLQFLRRLPHLPAHQRRRSSRQRQCGR